jgi:dolichyl-phosphate-mannose--protein O-mannosyl transferase
MDADLSIAARPSGAGSTLRTRLRAARGSWSLLDTIMVIGITALGGAMRFAAIRRPRAVWDETVYVPDACLYVRGIHGHCGTTSERSVVHPPLAKWLIGAGIRIFGYTPMGWRIAPLVAGVLSIAVMYLLARRLFGSTLTASLAAGLLAFDFLHFVMSRTAMLDIFVVFFSLAMFLCFVYDRDRRGPKSSSRRLDLRLRERPWLVGAGIAGGAAMASKWSGAYLLGAVVVLAFANDAARRRDTAKRFRGTTREEGAVLLIALVLAPLAIYLVSYAGRLHGSLLALPWSNGSWIRAFVARQHEMFNHHHGELFANPYSSAAWSWLLVKRPVAFDFLNVGGGRYQEVLALGNPLIWWAGIVATVATGWRSLRRRRLGAPETIVLAGFFSGYVPWLIISRNEAFLYYVLPALPFLYLALADAIARMQMRHLQVVAVAVVAAISVGMFTFYRPVLIGQTLSYDQWRARIIFNRCGEHAPDGRRQPVTKPIPPPPGWCWV